MGIRQRGRRKNRKRQKERARAHRAAQIAHWRPKCPGCGVKLIEDVFDEDVWHCAICGSTYLRQGLDLLPQHDEVFFLDTDALTQAA